MSGLFLLAISSVFLPSSLSRPISESGKVARIFFCHFFFVGIRPPDNFFYFHLPLCHFATFSVSLFFPYFSTRSTPDILKFATLPLFIFSSFPHLHLSIYFCFFIKKYKEIEIKRCLDMGVNKS